MKLELVHANDNRAPLKIQLKRFACLTIFFAAVCQLALSLKNWFVS